MRVYILKAKRLSTGETNIEGVFASYSAMKTWMKNRGHTIEVDDGCSLCGEFSVNSKFIKFLWDAHDLIGFHSVKTEQIGFKE